MYGWTDLHRAARDGDAVLCLKFIQRGDDIDAVDMLGKTPLHNAFIFNQRDVIHLLLKNGASATKKDSDGNSVLDLIDRYSSFFSF